MNTSSPYTFLIIHGTKGSPDINWFPWLKAQLEQRGHTVIAPHFPKLDEQNFDNWSKVAKAALGETPANQVILVGHSIGAAFVLRLAELAHQTPFFATFSVCPFIQNLGLPEYDRLNQTFVEHTFDWTKVKNGAGHLFLYAGDNDPYVPLAYSQDIAYQLNNDLNVIHGGGHLNGEFGYDKFEGLLADIDPILS